MGLTADCGEPLPDRLGGTTRLHSEIVECARRVIGVVSVQNATLCAAVEQRSVEWPLCNTPFYGTRLLRKDWIVGLAALMTCGRVNSDC